MCHCLCLRLCCQAPPPPGLSTEVDRKAAQQAAAAQASQRREQQRAEQERLKLHQVWRPHLFRSDKSSCKALCRNLDPSCALDRHTGEANDPVSSVLGFKYPQPHIHRLHKGISNHKVKFRIQSVDNAKLRPKPLCADVVARQKYTVKS